MSIGLFLKEIIAKIIYNQAQVNGAAEVTMSTLEPGQCRVINLVINKIIYTLIRDTEVSDGVKLFTTGLALFTFFIVAAFGCNLRAYLVSYLVSSISTGVLRLL